MTRHWHPTPAQTLLLHAALDRGPSAAAAWERWRGGGGDVQALDHHSARLLPLIAKNLDAHDVLDPASKLLRGVRRYAWVEHTDRIRRLMPHVAALVDGGVEVLFLKGVALAPLYYGELGLRLLADVDILVRGHEVPRAIELLAARGVRPHEPRSPSLARALRAETNLADEGYQHSLAFYTGDALELDLHWAVMCSNVGPHSDDAMWARAVPLAVAGVSGRTLSTTDHLLHVIIHGLSYSEVSTIRWIPDALAILRSPEHHVDWALLLEEAGRRDVALPLREALDYLVAELDAPVPRWVQDRLAQLRPTLFSRLRYAELMQEWDEVRAPWLLVVGAARFTEGRAPLDALHVATRYFRHRMDPRGPRYVATQIALSIAGILPRPMRKLLHRRGLG